MDSLPKAKHLIFSFIYRGLQFPKKSYFQYITFYNVKLYSSAEKDLFTVKVPQMHLVFCDIKDIVHLKDLLRERIFFNQAKKLYSVKSWVLKVVTIF